MRVAAALTLVVCGSILVGCGAQSGSPPGGQYVPLQGTRIAEGIYSGDVSCDYEFRAAGFGLLDSYTYDFNQSFSFGENGLPATGLNYDPNDDHLDLFGTRFDVTNRTGSSSDEGYVENAALTGVVDGVRMNGTITWTLTDAGAGSVDYRLDTFFSYRRDGTSMTEAETCHGVLSSPM